MVINLRSRQLRNLFNDVWLALPPRRRAALERRCFSVTDTPRFLPSPESRHALAALFSITYRKSILMLYLNPTRLPNEPADFTHALIEELLGKVFNARQRPVGKVGQ